MIARSGRPEKIYSDYFSTFAAAAKWIKKAVNSDENTITSVVLNGSSTYAEHHGGVDSLKGWLDLLKLHCTSQSEKMY